MPTGIEVEVGTEGKSVFLRLTNMTDRSKYTKLHFRRGEDGVAKVVIDDCNDHTTVTFPNEDLAAFTRLMVTVFEPKKHLVGPRGQ